MGSIGQFFATLFGVSSGGPTINAQSPIVDQVKDAIRKGITGPLGLPEAAVTALLSQSSLETRAWKSPVFGITHSLFNRHKGSGKGEWTGRTYYATSADPDLRIFTDIYQSARDMSELLQDPLYHGALDSLRQGRIDGYAHALQDAGFAVSDSYAQDIIATSSAYA